MGVIIQKRNQPRTGKKKNRRSNVNAKKALGAWNSHMKKVNKKMYW